MMDVQTFLAGELAALEARGLLPGEQAAIRRLQTGPTGEVAQEELTDDAARALRKLADDFARALRKLEPMNEHTEARPILHALIRVAGGWCPHRGRKLRTDATDIAEKTAEIAVKADRLAFLLDRREQLTEENALYDEGRDYSPRDWLLRAAEVERAPVAPELMGVDSAVHRWPSKAAVLRAIAEFARDAGEVATDDPLTAAAMSTRQASRSDLIRQALAVLGPIQGAGRLSDNNVAALLSVASGETISGDLVKKTRNGENLAREI